LVVHFIAVGVITVARLRPDTAGEERMEMGGRRRLIEISVCCAAFARAATLACADECGIVTKAL